VCRIIDSKSSLIPICFILTSGASLRASLRSVREKTRPLARGVPRDSLSLVPVSLAVIDDDVAAVVLLMSLLVGDSARAQTNTPVGNLHSNSGTLLRFHRLLFCSEIL